MAREKKTTKTTKTDIVASSALPAHLRTVLAEDAGKGLSTKREDNLIPLIYILQSQSPQVLARNPKYIKGSSAGDIWLRNSLHPIVGGDEGFLWQQCYFSKDWVEWKPRDSGGGFMGRHVAPPSDAVRVEDPKNPNKVSFVRKNGNEVNEVRNHFGFVIGGKFGLSEAPGLVMPYVITMQSSGHATSRAWMTYMRQFVDGGQEMPSFSRYYHLKTAPRSNASGDWFGWEFEDAGYVGSAEEYMRGRALFESMQRGERTAEDYDPDGREGSSEVDAGEHV